MHSGKYSGVNCHGKEKVKRFYEAFPDGKIDNFYSDSYSDSPLAEIAEKAFMVDGDKVEGWIFFKIIFTEQKSVPYFCFFGLPKH